MHETNEKITALYCRLSHEDSMQGESNSCLLYTSDAADELEV